MATPPPPPAPAPAYVYTREFDRFDYGPNHPLRMHRLALTHELIGACGLDQPAAEVKAAGREDLATFHDRRYLETLDELSRGQEVLDYHAFGLGLSDNPVFPGVYDLSALSAGASIAAADLVAHGGHAIAFSLSGGMHHALAARASGFCYVNDPVLAIQRLMAGGKRVAYLDIDAHHGDGVQWAFYETPQVLTISFHQHPATLFPGTGSLEELGRGAGRGYSVNLPLWPDTDDDVFVDAFDRLVPPILEAFKPDYLVTQLGVDTFLEDPLANLNLTTRGFAHCLRGIKALAPANWVALGGGGYHVVNVARGWTLAWAIMLGREDEVPERLPEDMADRLQLPEEDRWLISPEEKLRGRHWERAKRDAREAVNIIKRDVFPVLGARG